MISEILKEEKLVEMWPEYSCLVDVRSPEFKNRDLRQLAVDEMVKTIEENGT